MHVMSCELCGIVMWCLVRYIHTYVEGRRVRWCLESNAALSKWAVIIVIMFISYESSTHTCQLYFKKQLTGFPGGPILPGTPILPGAPLAPRSPWEMYTAGQTCCRHAYIRTYMNNHLYRAPQCSGEKNRKRKRKKEDIHEHTSTPQHYSSIQQPQWLRNT